MNLKQMNKKKEKLRREAEREKKDEIWKIDKKIYTREKKINNQGLDLFFNKERSNEINTEFVQFWLNEDFTKTILNIDEFKIVEGKNADYAALVFPEVSCCRQQYVDIQCLYDVNQNRSHYEELFKYFFIHGKTCLRTYLNADERLKEMSGMDCLIYSQQAKGKGFSENPENLEQTLQKPYARENEFFKKDCESREIENITNLIKVYDFNRVAVIDAYQNEKEEKEHSLLIWTWEKEKMNTK